MFKFRRWQKRETRSLHLNGKETENTNGLYYSKSVQQLKRKEEKKQTRNKATASQTRQYASIYPIRSHGFSKVFTRWFHFRSSNIRFAYWFHLLLDVYTSQYTVLYFIFFGHCELVWCVAVCAPVFIVLRFIPSFTVLFLVFIRQRRREARTENNI